MVFLHTRRPRDRFLSNVYLSSGKTDQLPWPHVRKRYFSHKPLASRSVNLHPSAVPHVTILRPVKGLEPYLYECLAATFLQTYPKDKLTIYFCVSSHNDPAYPTLQQLLKDFSTFDATVMIEEEDSNLSGNGKSTNLGPNPKIRNMSRGYREAKGDIIWIIDCNVWVGYGVAGRMVDMLCGFTDARKGIKHKFVHQLPLVVDISDLSPAHIPPHDSPVSSPPASFFSNYGGLLEELFMSTAHAKFYTAISAVAIAPCIVGKSNMFRRSHLNALTSGDPSRSPGIDFFSENICEDHLIGDLLWKSPVPHTTVVSAENEGSIRISSNETLNAPSRPFRASKWRNHGLVPCDLCIQPMRLSLSDYVARRVRWLRVRKFTVPLATLVEAGTESFVCTLYLAFGATTHPFCTEVLQIPQTWTAFWTLWIFGVLSWMGVDWITYSRLQGGSTIEGRGPEFTASRKKRGVREWLLGWTGREILAFWVWLWAVFGGVQVVWRGSRFWVGFDMRVHKIAESIKGNGDEGKARKLM